MPPHKLFFCFKKFPILEIAPFFLPHSNPWLPLQRHMQCQYGSWCPLLKEWGLQQKSFFPWWSPNFFVFELPNYNPQKGTCNFNGNSILPLCFCPTFLNSPPSYLSQLPNLTTLPHFPNLQPRQLPAFPIFSTSPLSYLSHLLKLATLLSTVKALQNNNIRLSLSTSLFNRRFTISNLKSKAHIFSSRETSSDHWVWALIC